MRHPPDERSVALEDALRGLLEHTTPGCRDHADCENRHGGRAEHYEWHNAAAVLNLKVVMTTQQAREEG